MTHQNMRLKTQCGHNLEEENMTYTEQIEMKISEIVLELSDMGRYGIGQLAGVLVERRPDLAVALKVSIEECEKDKENATQ